MSEPTPTEASSSEAVPSDAAPAEKAPVASPAAPPAAPAGKEYPFQAEVQKVLGLVIDSLYANKEVFLRELVSNASDALDKARLFALTHEGARPQEGEAKIAIRIDEEKRTLTVEDNGVGMSQAEIIENLGTIAKSGTLDFLKKHQDQQKAVSGGGLRLIGQFGVGFYAAFMVADRVDVSTLGMAPDAEPVHWSSVGHGSFTVAPGERTTPGTTITLHLKDDHRDYLKKWRLQEIITRYSDFVPFPIEIDGELSNKAKALWTLPKSQVTEEQHTEFFRHLTGGDGGTEPMLVVHQSVDAPVQYNALLYVPSKAPFDLFKQERQALKLYAKRVLILESCEKLTPLWLRFLRGVVDSEDLSLNVSREMLQENATLARIEQQLVKAVLKALGDLAKDDPAKYALFWKEFGRVLKEGITLDWKNKDAIFELCRFESMQTAPGEVTSLRAYVDAMPEGQKDIYFVTGIGRRAVEASPHLEAFRRKGWDVLFLVDPIDEWVTQAATEYDGKQLKSIAHGAIDLDEPPHEDAAADPVDAIAAIKEALGDKVKDVRFSKRLVDSASVLVAEEGSASANMERIMKMMDDRAGRAPRILELNPRHPVVKNLALLAHSEPHSTRVKAYSQLLLDQALLAEGVVDDPAALVGRIQDLLVQATTAATASVPAGGAAAAGPKPADPKAADPKAADPKAADPKAADPKVG